MDTYFCKIFDCPTTTEPLRLHLQSTEKHSRRGRLFRKFEMSDPNTKCDLFKRSKSRKNMCNVLPRTNSSLSEINQGTHPYKGRYPVNSLFDTTLTDLEEHLDKESSQSHKTQQQRSIFKNSGEIVKNDLSEEYLVGKIERILSMLSAREEDISLRECKKLFFEKNRKASFGEHVLFRFFENEMFYNQ